MFNIAPQRRLLIIIYIHYPIVEIFGYYIILMHNNYYTLTMYF